MLIIWIWVLQISITSRGIAIANILDIETDLYVMVNLYWHWVLYNASQNMQKFQPMEYYTYLLTLESEAGIWGLCKIIMMGCNNIYML